MSEQATRNDVPTPDDIRAAVDRMVTSHVFSRSPQLGAFLRFVVEAVLRGKADRIKAYTIGVEVLRRDIRFDPQLDPIVRVEATRLRRTIERYYSGPGAGDAIIIDLPRGSYVPTFRWREADIITATSPASAPLPGLIERISALARTQPVFAALIAGAVIASVTAAAVVLRSDTQPTAASGLRPGNGMPTLAVQQFDVIGTPGPNAVWSTALYEKSRDAFARFDAINVVSEPARPEVRVNYRFAGLVDYRDHGITRIHFRLSDVGDGSVVWTRTFERPASTDDRAAAENEIVSAVAATLLQPFGILRSRENAKDLATSAGDARYRCLLLTADAFRTFDRVEYDRARACLERVIALDPKFGDGFSYLAALNLREYVYGFGRSADDATALDRALQLARRGVEINPTGARAYQVLSTVLFCRRDAAANAAAERAIELNPYDSIISGDYGGRLIAAGEIERGMNLVRQSAGRSGVQPSWHHFHLFLGSYMTGDLPEATRHADAMTSNTYTHGLMARALTAAANGDREKAQSALDRLVTVRPAWRDNPRGELGRYVSAAFIVDRLVADLTKAGVNSVSTAPPSPPKGPLPSGNARP